MWTVLSGAARGWKVASPEGEASAAIETKRRTRNIVEMDMYRWVGVDVGERKKKTQATVVSATK
jgi:hypothetical protein